MHKKIAVIAGDGIGPEITKEAVGVLKAVAGRYGHNFSFNYVEMGGCAIDKWGTPLPKSTLNECLASDSVLLGAVGGPKWDKNEKNLRPEKGLLDLRAGMKLYANLRPAKLFHQLSFACPLKQQIIDRGIDLITVRELTGGIYFGTHHTEGSLGSRVATDVLVYTEQEIERIVRVACETARKRKKKITSVDKANVLDSSRLWREVAHRVALDYPDVMLSDMLVDNAAMQLVRDPSQFDVLVTENMFGDILSDEASMVVGSIGMMPSASLGDGTCGVYEPIHGSAPELAGTDSANPIGTILSAAMMLRHSFDLNNEAEAVENAVNAVLTKGYRTADIFTEEFIKIGCREMGERIVEALI